MGVTNDTNLISAPFGMKSKTDDELTDCLIWLRMKVNLDDMASLLQSITYLGEQIGAKQKRLTARKI